MYQSILIRTVLSGVLVTTLGTQADGHLCPWKRANNCPYVIMAGGCGTRDVTGGYTIAQCRSTVVCYGCHRTARFCSVPGYTCATPWAFLCGCGDCGSGCGGSCGGGGCDGCYSEGGASYGGETYTGEMNEEVISDGPAPAESETGAIDNKEARRRVGNFHLASDSRRDGSSDFDRGVAFFRGHSLRDALQSFEAAAEAEPASAMYQYYRALTLFELNGAEAAGEALAKAVELEGREAVANWGRRMERVQGRGRVWVEKARREAGLVR